MTARKEEGRQAKCCTLLQTRPRSDTSHHISGKLDCFRTVNSRFLLPVETVAPSSYDSLFALLIPICPLFHPEQEELTSRRARQLYDIKPVIRALKEN